MEDIPPGGRSGPWPHGGPFPFPECAKAERVEFTDEQKREVASAMLLAAYLSAHRTMINGSALCAALAVTERD